MGNGQPAGEAGFNIARVAALLAGLPNVPGVTVNRYCSSSLQTIRMAAHAIRAGEGDVFVAAGVEAVSRYRYGAADTGPHNRAFGDAEARTAARGPAVTEPWTPFAGMPDVYIAMGQTAENVAEFEKVTREEMDEYALLSQTRAVESQANGFFDREIIPVTLPDGTVVTSDDGPRANTTLEGLASLKPVFREGGRITAGNACPLNDGAAAVVVMSDTRASELGITPLARIVASAVSGLDPEIMGLGPVEACRQALGRAKMTIEDIDLVEINEAFAAQVIPSARAPRDPVRQAEREGRRDRARPPLRPDRREDHDDAPQRARGHRLDVRDGVDVRRRWPGHGHGGRAAALSPRLAARRADAWRARRACRPHGRRRCSAGVGRSRLWAVAAAATSGRARRRRRRVPRRASMTGIDPGDRVGDLRRGL